MKVFTLIALIAATSAINLRFNAYSNKDKDKPSVDAYGATSAHYVIQKSSDVPN